MDEIRKMLDSLTNEQMEQFISYLLALKETVGNPRPVCAVRQEGKEEDQLLQRSSEC